MNRHLKSLAALLVATALTAAPRHAGAETPNFNADIPPPADTKPIYPPPPAPPQDDRKGGNGAAIAAAIIGAAMAGASCAMLMKQAADARAAGDTQQANQLMMMAMQQCAQAAANAANAAQNKDGGNKLTQSDPGQPKWADLPQGETKKADTKAAALSLPSSSSEEKEEEETVDPVEFKGLDDRAFAAPPGTEPGPEGDIGGSIGGGIVKLDPIDNASVQYDDSSKGGGKTPQTPLGASSSVVGGTPTNGAAKISDGGLDFGGEDGKAPKIAGRSSRITGGGPSSAGGEGGAHSSSSSGGGFDMAGLMAQLTGGKPGEAGGGAPQDILAFKKTKKEDGTNVTIFQYASFRYRKAQRDDGLVIDLKKKVAQSSAVPPAPARAPASKPAPPPAKPGKGFGERKPLGKPTVVSRR